MNCRDIIEGYARAKGWAGWAVRRWGGLAKDLFGWWWVQDAGGPDVWMGRTALEAIRTIDKGRP